MISFLQNSNGELSSSRLLMIITNLAILGVWVYASISSINSGGPMVPMPTEVATFSGLTILGKVVNSALAERPTAS